MRTGEAPDPLALGQRIVAVLETGLRTATYKLATLTALIEHCVEHLPEHPDAALDVPVDDLAHRVVEVYWRQVRAFEGHELRQSTQPAARILRAVNALRDAAGARHTGMPLELAMLRVPEDYRRTVRDVGLARLSGLLKPTLEILWVEDVRRMNRFLDEKVPDVAGHLFGRDRISLAPARTALKDAFGATCFYCGAGLAADNPVDHVLPWSRLGIDGLANLVLACGRCNSSKLQSLPAMELVDRALGRDRSLLEELAGSIDWPTQYDRVVAAARGIYRGEPEGSPTWAGVGRTAFLDLSTVRDWPA